MSDGTKTVLIVGGVAVVGYLLLSKASGSSLFAPRPATGYSSPQALGGLIGSAIGGFAGALGGSGAANQPASGNAVSSSTSSATAPSLPAGFDTSNYSVSNGFEYTDASGNFVAG